MGWILAAIFLVFAGGNAGIVLRGWVRKKGGSLVPLIGGLAGLGAFLTLPFSGLSHWWWIPLLADIGTGYLIVTAVFLIHRASTNSDVAK